MGGCANCCKVCCYSTPFVTISALSVTVVGLVGFLSSSVYGVVMVDSSEDLQNHTVILAPLVGGVAGSTILPLLLATCLAYCSTGYTRDELYHPCIKTCISSCCSSLVILLTFIYLVVWVCFTVLYSMITTVYIQLNLACKEYDDSRDLGDTCTHLYTATDEVTIQSCGNMDSICNDGQKVGLSLSISLGFALLVVVGLVLVLIVQSANFIRVRECEKRSYRPKGNY